ncbi:hypothetical protein O6H91_05G044500 [Diphasiastrum complanatum]|uniref:Uncharacterized protein n=1 Tax=Diphasiastrum complanatum TaxID=34168 RepID=A0ACC2DN26_DIPCM|nr:hypothetical protein O6H91_Y337200 [Diphasiastrum complanatum]KAJ7285372.1 hypothetical protein O6H91_Y337200 [Diphasiastrum complanatum]KAJ7555560.1 hypothetical protein O6H91_05G044500 [Diphasiastrum complanatum]
MSTKQVAQDNGGKKPMWVYPETTGADPPERWGHSACFSDGTLYIFGGCCGGLHFSDVLTLDLKTMCWSSLVSTGQQPGTRDSHSAVLVGHRMIIFGGTNGSKKINDVYILDLRTQSWSHPSVKGEPPAPRESHSATLVGDNKVVVFGGSGEGDGNYLNDVHILHLDSMEWTSPEVKGELPACRDSHTAVAIGNQLVVYGGDCGDRYLGELDILDLQTLTWTKLGMAGGTQPGVRAGHAAVTVGNKMYIFGGVGDRAYYNDVWMLDINSRVWTVLDVVGPQPQGRFSHVAVLAENDIAVYGGCGEDERPLNEFMVLCLQADQLSEDSPLRRYLKNHNGLSGRRGHGGLKNVVEANLHENGGCCSEGKNDDGGKDNLRLIDLMGGNIGHACKWKEEFIKSTKRNCLEIKTESRVPLSQASCPLSIPTLNEADNCHSPGLSTISNASASKRDSYSVLQRRIRSRKVPLPYIEQLMGQAPENNHADLKRRKTSHLISKLEGMDSEPDDHSPSISQHSSPSQSDPEQVGQKLHATQTNSKSLQPQFAMFLPQQSPGTLAHTKYQQAQHYVQQVQQHQQNSHLGSQPFSTEQQSPKGEHMLRIPTLQLQVRLPAHQTISLPVRGTQSAQLKPVAIDHCVQDSAVKTLLQQRQSASSISGDRQQRQTRIKCLPNLVGSEVRGLVDGAFDSGYLMTAQLNGQVFRGVLFPHCSASGLEEVNVPLPNQNNVHPTMSPAHQPSVIIPASVAQQSSSNGTLIGYPVFPSVHFTNPIQTAGTTRVCLAANSSSEMHNANKLSNSNSILCPSVATVVGDMQRAAESNMHCNLRQNATIQVTTTGATRVNDTAHGETIHVHAGSTQPHVEMVGNAPVITGQGGRWVWQPAASPSASYTIPWTYHAPVGNVGDNIQFVAVPPFPGVAFAPAHVVNEVHPSVRASSVGTALQAGQNIGRDSVADLQAAVTLSLAAPGISSPAVSNQKS